jgi:ketosteroid isomerase-like protein
VEILSHGYEALNRRDFATVRGLLHADAVWRDAGDLPDAITHRAQALQAAGLAE